MRKYVYPDFEHVMKVTDFKTPELAKAVIRTLQWLDEGAPKAVKLSGRTKKLQFDMGVYSVTEADCGTTCCMAGAIRFFQNQDTSQYVSDDFADHIDSWGQKVLSPELNHLFHTEYYGYLDVITPFEAAQTLRRYLKTGVVEWNLSYEALDARLYKRSTILIKE